MKGGGGPFFYCKKIPVQKLGRALARQSGEDEDQTVRHLFQKLSLLLMKGNSALLINRVPVADIDPGIGGWE